MDELYLSIANAVPKIFTMLQELTLFLDSFYNTTRGKYLLAIINTFKNTPLLF